MRVAEPSAPAASHHGALADGHQVREQLARLVAVDRRARRNVEDQVVAGPTVTPRARAAAAGGRPVVALLGEVAQGGLAGIDAQVDGSTAASVPAVRAAARDMRFLPEGRGPVAAVAGADPDLHAVEEHRGHSRMGVGPSGHVRRRRRGRAVAAKARRRRRGQSERALWSA